MQGRTRAKKSNKNVRPAPQVDFTLLTKEQKADASSRKELDVFIANPVPEPKKKERISSVFLAVDPDAFDRPHELPREMKDVVAERNVAAELDAAQQQMQLDAAQRQMRQDAAQRQMRQDAAQRQQMRQDAAQRQQMRQDAAQRQQIQRQAQPPRQERIERVPQPVPGKGARPLTQAEELIVAAWMQEQGMDPSLLSPRFSGDTQVFPAVNPDRAGRAERPAGTQAERTTEAPPQPSRGRSRVSDDTQVFSLAQERTGAPEQQRLAAPSRYPERRQRIPTEADAEWQSRRKMRGETPAQKAYRAAMSLPGADESLKKVQAVPRPAAPQPAQAQPLRAQMATQQMPPLRAQTQQMPPVRTKAPAVKDVITPEPPRPAATVEPAPAEKPLLPEESPLADPAPEAVRAEKPKKAKPKPKPKKQQASDDHTVITDLQTEIPVREGMSTTRPEAYREEREKRRKKEERLTYIIVACVVLFLVAGFFLLRIYLNYRRGADEYAELNANYVVMPETASAGETDAAAAEAEEYPRLNIDFNSLSALNEDLVGWIYVPGCGISYPIVRGQDNDYYLNHTFLKSSSSSGAIFMDYQDAAGFIDFNTFIYGHNLKDGTMFTALGNYRTDPDLIREYPYFYIYRSNGSIRKYRICAFYNDEGYSDSYFRVTTPEDKAAYIAMINTKSVMTQGLPLAEGEHEVSAQDLLVTLSTCQDSVRSGRRFLVHGYLVGSYIENKR
ncbi:MAG: sortase [Lachnospiraceae bacterium]|nr:sortase [Lachnospiraceae bacterium]